MIDTVAPAHETFCKQLRWVYLTKELVERERNRGFLNIEMAMQWLRLANHLLQLNSGDV